MNFVIPMAGRGQRFKDEGYALPKMLIEAKGKTLLEWSVDSLPTELCTRLIFVLLKEHMENHQLVDFIKSKYSGSYDLYFVKLDEVTRGQAETVLKAKEFLNTSTDLLIFNIDTAFTSPSLISNLLDKDCDGVLGAFLDKSDSTKYSYAKLGDKENIVEVAEKVHISNNALTGLYHFKRTNDFIRIAEQHIKDNLTSKGEFYIAPMYNELIKEGKSLKLDFVSELHILGTPEELYQFIES